MYINETTIQNVGAAIQRHLVSIPAFRKTSASGRRVFSTDLALIALGVRTGHLVDAIAPSDLVRAFSQLLEAIRKEFSIFNNVLLLHDESAEQVFFVNTPLLRQRACLLGITRSLCDNSVHFLRLADTPILLPDVPDELRALVSVLIAQLPETSTDHSNTAAVALPLALALPSVACTPQTLVPLAGIILEYPLAYVPADNPSPGTSTQTFLAGEPVDVYRCLLKATGTSHNDRDASSPSVLPHSLLQFSCPASAGEMHPCLAPERLIACLGAHFTARLEGEPSDRVDGQGQLMVEVKHTREVFDRLAL
ncbi:hypothetical protein HGRIS_006089 [Hohenbuehelia grisea]|uniref:Uncharacterized protein n=1 Tax=Hohenbuehelia grisea TaxID=104357 RepID=A0ABR3K1B0_9AGAR